MLLIRVFNLVFNKGFAIQLNGDRSVLIDNLLSVPNVVPHRRGPHAGYAMKVIFDPVNNGRMRGRIYIPLPDEQKSFPAGTFDAEFAKAAQPLAGK